MNLELANQLLKDYKATCIILKNEEIIYTSTHIGVKPLLLFLNQQVTLEKDDRLTLIDKIIGKAALLLAVKCKINRIYTPIISAEALTAAKHYNIEWEADSIVPHIINREGTGKCPIEASVTDTIDLDEAFDNIKGAIAQLMRKANG
ncbi:MAG: hypothetical protein K0R09_3164 [Clostridiales bacterium]|jgi:iron complex outermembrane receptor protein|nr:hypothetical protein [Clostridiales bacterium]